MRSLLIALTVSIATIGTSKADYLQFDFTGWSDWINQDNQWFMEGTVWVDTANITWNTYNPWFERANIKDHVFGSFTWTNGTSTFQDSSMEGLVSDYFYIQRRTGNNNTVALKDAVINSVNYSTSSLDPDFYAWSSNTGLAGWDGGINPGVNLTVRNTIGGGFEPDGRWSVQLVSSVPEPSTIAMMLGGLGLVGLMAARRRKV